MAKWKIKDLFWVTDPEPEPAAALPVGAHSAAPAASLAQPSPVDRVLSMLRDVDGVVGSLAVANGGDVLGSDLPRLFDQEAMQTLALRLSQLRAALFSADTPLRTAAFRYESHALHVSQLDCGLLGVLAELRTHVPALEMASKLVGQRLDAAVSRGATF
jgi:predicted regulator of Ras-like GTPase activity (Roadblock/LC7/MglB family)